MDSAACVTATSCRPVDRGYPTRGPVYNASRMPATTDDSRFLEAQRYHQAGQVDRAAELYRRLLADQPEHAAAHHLLGLACSQRGDLVEALAHLRQALRLDPGNPAGHCNLGEALRRTGDVEGAKASFRRALALDPGLAEAHFNLANSLEGQGRLAEAVGHYRQALDARPGYARAAQRLGRGLAQLAAILAAEGRMDEALRHFDEAATLQPGSAEALNQLGSALQASGRIEEAVEAFHRALAQDPQARHILHNIGLAEKQRGRVDAAREAYRQALALDPASGLLRLEMETLYPFILANNAAIDRYRADLDATLDRFQDLALEIDLSQLHLGEACPPYVLVYQGRNDRALKEKWARLFADRLPSGEPRPGAGRPHIGFVVTQGHDFVFVRSLRGILNRLPAERFRVTIVCNRAAGARFIRDSLDNPAIGFLLVPPRLDEAADAIRAARFDLLYYWEIGTDTANYFLPFFRLAPVQCTSWGWQVTSGIPQVDHYVSSRLLEPPDAAEHYSEHLVLLDTLLTAYERPALPERPPDPAHYGFRADQHIYFCAQSLLKIHPDFDPLAAEILRRDPAGVLVFVGLKDPYPAELLRARLRATMPDLMARVHFLPRQPEDRFLGLLALADVVLDTRHYGGVNTTYQALAAGAPVVTWPGAFQRGRYTAGAYRRMGLPDCVADSAAGYVETALALGTDRARRDQISRRIHAGSPVLFEDAQAAVELADWFEATVAEARSGSGQPAGRSGRERSGARARRILFVDPSPVDYAVDTPYRAPLGGSESAACYLAEQLAALGHRVTMLTRVSRPRVLRGVACLAWRDDPAWLVDLAGWLGVEVAVFINTPPAPELAALRPRARLLLWPHNADDQPIVGVLADPAHRDLLDGVAFVSRWQRDAYLARFGLAPERCVVLPNAIGPAFRDLFGADERILGAKREPILAYASAPYRGLDLLLDAFPAIRAAVPAAHLRIFSSMLTYQRGDAEPLFAPLYERARTMPGVEYVGAVPQAELAAALRGAAVLAYPNTFAETFCITALEALAAGCQVVTSDLGALPDTSAGFARLLSWDEGREAYRAAFEQAVIEALGALSDPATEGRLRRQVDTVNRQARWEARAADWARWVEAVVET